VVQAMQKWCKSGASHANACKSLAKVEQNAVQMPAKACKSGASHAKVVQK
jgi:hypothetical protein